MNEKQRQNENPSVSAVIKAISNIAELSENIKEVISAYATEG